LCFQLNLLCTSSIAFVLLKVRETNRFRQNLTHSQSLELSITKMLLCVVLVFGICYLPMAGSLLGANKLDPKLTYQIFLFGVLTTSVNSAVNFTIYCLMSSKFRSVLIELWNNPKARVTRNRRGTNATLYSSVYTVSTNSTGIEQAI